ncbi:carbohydrate-binding module family 50 protein [Rhizoctonia solani AG-3 Rhs1AP]|uniref:Carbohydrate-binding module family 50 protein n=2 Tax=Rhizoctonia solani AG-3 TaxID=1086053 RepID=A0A074SAI6_9AGAM|nr:carbohydrate-binding module family 50 protein [Rhizoctonia solani AG-3 Rhs1AP]KEP53893.1 carbohydrate-binding module family 50 protein [Rhizoctonia solani 123E]
MTSVTVPLCLACSQELSTKNARLRRYNPCLSCLGGVGLVQSTGRDRAVGNSPCVQHGRDNEAETFIVGDSEDEGDLEPPSTRIEPDTTDARPRTTPPKLPETPNPTLPQSSTYYIKPRDTVTGIALKHGVDPRQLCQLNKLPTSTLTTTPHLLHTHTTLQLPPGARAPSPPPPDLLKRLEARANERTGKAFQAITKESDWGVAQTYVALLDIEDDGIKEGKRRMVDSSSSQGRQALAVDQYLDDNAWEEEQRKAGLSPRIEPFPYFGCKGKESVEPCKEDVGAGSSWWRGLMSGSSSKRW